MVNIQRFKSLLLNGYILAHIATFCTSIVTSIVAVNIFRSEEYVEFMTAFAVMNFLVPIVTMGAPSYIIKCVRAREGLLGVRSDVLTMIVFGCLIAAILLYVYNLLFGDIGVPFFWALGSSISLALINIAGSSYRAESRPKKYFIGIAGSKFFLVVFVIFFGAFPLGESAGIILALAIITSSVVTLCLVKFQIMPDGGWEAHSLWRPLYFSIPLVVGNLIVLFYPFYERTLLSRLDDPEQVGVYIFVMDLALKAAGGFLIFMKVTIFPKVMGMNIRQGDDLIRKARYVVVASALSVVLLVYCAWIIVGDGEYFRGYGGNIPLYLCMAILLGMLTILSYTSVIKLVRVGRTYPVAIAGGAAVSTYAFLATTLINDFGVKGGGGAMLISALINTLFLEIFCIFGKKNDAI
ncbi:hypothetical protein A6D6_03714 [Alcanivorax xiamenensis]|uniref:Membrane protein involved in the export of O-antigen and teichoic acid n=1 Tax=Alcanivorax xiamenensis TaxID=1177156 RepID=A0ABQ6Y480_9GAMM|nr:oligosaccharide flippase family protein [Alcanivorax xiamenensis]KAF0803375.1 hypothetical protein A6D6_03714 [Alcanivorax xiamenensis]